MLRFISIGIFLFLVGCSSAIETAKLARTQSMLVQTPRAEGAKCIITDARGREWRVRKTPSTVAVEDGHSPLHIVCSKRDFKTTAKKISEHKEELLTIDGKRVTAGIYDQFPTKAPRLIPTAIKETASFLLDPTGQVSTEYPDEVVVWMEPERWDSEAQKIAWAYDREIQENQDYVESEDARIKDDERKEVRRGKKHAREEDRKELYEDGKDFVKEHLQAKTYVKYTESAAKYSTDQAAVVSKGAVDTSTILLVGSGHIAQEMGEGFSDMADVVNIKEGMDWLQEKSKQYQVPWKVDENSKWTHFKDSSLEKSKWVPNWLRLTPSTVSAVGNREPVKQAVKKDDEDIVDINLKESLSDVPPWVRESGDFNPNQ